LRPLRQIPQLQRFVVAAGEGEASIGLKGVMLADVRRAKLRRFPYGRFFPSLEDAIYVIACLHSSRNPAIWQSRI